MYASEQKSPLFEESQLCGAWVVYTVWLLICMGTDALPLVPWEPFFGQAFEQFLQGDRHPGGREDLLPLIRFAFQFMLVSSSTKYNPLRKGTINNRKKVVVVVGLWLETNNWFCGSWEHGNLLTWHQGSEAWCLGRVLASAIMNLQVCRYAGSKWWEG